MIIAREKGLEVAPKAKGIAIGLTLYSENRATVIKRIQRQVIEENRGAAPEFDEIPVTPKLSFPSVIDPNSVRNDFYVILKQGQFLQDKKRSVSSCLVRFLSCFFWTCPVVHHPFLIEHTHTQGKNIEVVLEVRDNKTGALIPNALSPGVLAGGEELAGPPKDFYRSCVYYHDNNPEFTDIVRVDPGKREFTLFPFLL